MCRAVSWCWLSVATTWSASPRGTASRSQPRQFRWHRLCFQQLWWNQTCSTRLWNMAAQKWWKWIVTIQYTFFYLWPKWRNFENALDSKHRSKYQIQIRKDVREFQWSALKLNKDNNLILIWQKFRKPSIKQMLIFFKMKASLKF